MITRRPSSCRSLDRAGRRLLDRVGDAEQARRPAVDRDEDDRLALAPQLVGLARQRRRDRSPARRRTPGCRSPRSGPRPGPSTPCPVCDWNASAAASASPVLARGAGDRRGQRMLARLFEAGGQSEQLGFVLARRRHDRHQPGLALGQRAGLVDDQGVDPLQDLERLGVLDQHAGAGPAAGPDHDRHRRGQPEGTRAGDDQHRDGVDQRVRHAAARGRRRPRR